MKLSKAATILNATLVGPDVEFQSVSIDTRTLQKEALFVALQGPNFNAHHFIKQAAERGAVAVVVSENIKTDLPQLQVKNTKLALAQLGAYQRQQVNIPVIAVTGSCGKTTTRALLASVFRQCGNTLASENSFNNDIGVPLTLLQLQPTHEYAIFELGANHAGEIAYLTTLVKPSLSIITNAGPAHLAGFGDVKGVSRAKGEIFQGLNASGTAIINQDDQFADFWRTLVPSQGQIISFGVKNKADVSARDIKLDSQGYPHFVLVLPNATAQIKLPLLGEHNILNALAAAAAAYAFDLPITAIKQGLEAAAPVNGRLVTCKGYRGATIIDDSYNANPSSVTAAIQVLASQPGHSVLVFGDMLELGQEGLQFHREIGERALRLGINQLYCYGPLSQYAANAFGPNAYHFENKQALITALKNNLQENSTVLIKGSLSMGMKQVAVALLENDIQ